MGNEDIQNADGVMPVDTEVETHADPEHSASSEVYPDGAEPPKRPDDTDTDGTVVEDDTPDEGDEHEGDDEEGAEQSLPEEFDADNEEVVAAYDAHYLKDGELRMDVLSAEWQGNIKEGEEVGSLNESTYSYLGSLGIPRDMAKAVEAGQVALQKSFMEELYTRIGGKGAWDAASKWATDGGYTQVELEAFNKAMNSGDVQSIQMAVDALGSRHGKATATGQPAPRRRRQVRAQRAVAGNSPAPTVRQAEGFKNRLEYREAMRKAGDEPSAVAEVNRRLRASDWFGKS